MLLFARTFIPFADAISHHVNLMAYAWTPVYRGVRALEIHEWMACACARTTACTSEQCTHANYDRLLTRISTLCYGNRKYYHVLHLLTDTHNTHEASAAGTERSAIFHCTFLFFAIFAVSLIILPELNRKYRYICVCRVSCFVYVVCNQKRICARKSKTKQQKQKWQLDLVCDSCELWMFDMQFCINDEKEEGRVVWTVRFTILTVF